MKLPDLKAPLLYMGVRVITAWMSPIPGAVVIDPLPILLARQQTDSTHAGWTAWLYLPGLVLGDLLAGFGLWTLLLRLLVICLFIQMPSRESFHFLSWRWTFQFSLATGILVDVAGFYPLGFITLAGVVQGFLWWGILAPAAGGGKVSPLWPLLASPSGLIALHLLLPSPGLWPLPVLGDQSSIWIIGGAVFLLVEPLSWRFRRPRREPDREPEIPRPVYLSES